MFAGRFPFRRFPLRAVSIMALVLSAGAALSPGTARGGYIYVANFNGGTIGEYTTSGSVVNASLVTGLRTPNGIAVTPTPEPSTLALLGAGGLALLVYAWRRRRNRCGLGIAAESR